MLINALLFLMQDKPKVDNAISEICYAIYKAGGEIPEEIINQLKEKSLWIYYD